jgi:hypothetical protein
VHELQRRHIVWFAESWVYFCIGLVLGLVEVAAGAGKLTEIVSSLHTSFAETFFVLLLPTVGVSSLARHASHPSPPPPTHTHTLTSHPPPPPPSLQSACSQPPRGCPQWQHMACGSFCLWFCLLLLLLLGVFHGFWFVLGVCGLFVFFVFVFFFWGGGVPGV